MSNRLRLSISRPLLPPIGTLPLPRRPERRLGLVQAIGHAAVRAVRRSPSDLGAVRAPRESDKGSGAPQGRRFESR
jgi:hypothetical protein